MTKMYNLFSSDGCHLCEQALALIQQQLPAKQINIIDIVEHEEYVELYGVHIPVFERIDNNEKLFWPFSLAEISQLINSKETF